MRESERGSSTAEGQTDEMKRRMRRESNNGRAEAKGCLTCDLCVMAGVEGEAGGVRGCNDPS